MPVAAAFHLEEGGRPTLADLTEIDTMVGPCLFCFLVFCRLQAQIRAARPGLPCSVGLCHVVARLSSSIGLRLHHFQVTAPQACHTFQAPCVPGCCWALSRALACLQVTVVDASTFGATMASSATLQDSGQAASAQDRRSLAGLLTDQVRAADTSTAAAPQGGGGDGV